MKHQLRGFFGAVVLVVGVLMHGTAGCGSSPGSFFDTDASRGDSGTAYDASSDASRDATTRLPGSDSGLKKHDGSATCPSSCSKLNASCGAATDTYCGGVVECGTCPAGQSCGGGGVHNVCGAGGEGGSDGPCTPKTCADLGITCGEASDGCGHTLQCGSCASPQTCGGDPSKPGKCGCTGECASVYACDAGSPTTLSGTVYDPAGNHPLYNVLVYIPNNPADPGLQPFTPGVTCSQCGATAAGDPLVTTYTAPDGTFTLSNVPVGSQVPVVIQLGRWRRQYMVNTSNICSPNPLPYKLQMPATHAEGDIPYIAILSGSFDPVECVLRQIGIADSEFTNPGASGNGGHIQFYLADETNNVAPGECGSGESINASTPAQSALFGTTAGVPTINQYDMVILECECYPQAESAADQAALLAYTSAGGRVFASDYAYSWLYQNGNFASAAHWAVNQNGGGAAQTGNVDLVSNPQGTPFDQWLVDVGVSVAGSNTVGTLDPVFHNSNGVVSPTQQWLYWNNGATKTPIQFTYNTPVGADAGTQCGRVVYNDWHAQNGLIGNGRTFPSVCPGTAMTAQEIVLEFMFFDLAACVQPYTPVCTPNTCMGEGVECGPASDGCGNLLNCGTCMPGQTCGGGGSGKCGTSAHCTPETCMSQGIECGQAGDGCGNVINCGNCATGEICGANGAGKCGMIQ